MMITTEQEAKAYLNGLPRIFQFQEREYYNSPVFLLPRGVDFEINEKSEIRTIGLSPEYDCFTRDVISPILPIDLERELFQPTNVLTSLIYAESLQDILWHVTTQSILHTTATHSFIEWVRKTQNTVPYGKHPLDSLWLPCNRPIEQISEGDRICIFNRRISGWDGSRDRPVIELLGTGGHLPMMWDNTNKKFRRLSLRENLQKEASEELGITILPNQIRPFGRYVNTVTHELVILAGLEISAEILPAIETYAAANLDADTLGVYFGIFSDVIAQYRKDPAYFAGGQKAFNTNFPNNTRLMQRIESFFSRI